MIRGTTGLALLLFATACSNNSPEPTATASTALEAAAPSLPDGEEGLKAYADCTAKIEAVARLYDVIAENTSDSAQAAKLKDTAKQRHEAAERFKERASALASDLGRADEPAKLIAAAEAALQSEEKGKPFEEFAVWLGREADTCAPLDPPKS